MSKRDPARPDDAVPGATLEAAIPDAIPGAIPDAGAVRAYLGLGSNLGDRAGQLREAIDRIDALEGVRVVAVSAFYETQPRFVEEQPDFLNAAAAIETTLSPRALLEHLLAIEAAMGRVRTLHRGPRSIDLDILLFGSFQIEEEGLQIPHPGIAERAFVLVPLAEIAPDVRHPALDLPLSTLERRCADRGWVRPVG